MKDKVFKPVDFTDRGPAYVKHHHKMMGNVRRFTTNTPCPKCGGYHRQYVKGKNDTNTSFCIHCHNVTGRKVEEKKGRDRYLNKTSSNLTIEQRRAIEDHQHRTNDLEDYLL